MKKAKLPKAIWAIDKNELVKFFVSHVVGVRPIDEFDENCEYYACSKAPVKRNALKEKTAIWIHSKNCLLKHPFELN